MFQILRPLLILALVLTSIGLGSARGMITQNDQIVLCTGDGVIFMPRPDSSDDSPYTLVHFCPDMALSMLAALTPDDVTLPVRQAAPYQHPLAGKPKAIPVIWSEQRARAPPWVSAAPRSV